jgi:hypothetical protein
MKAVVCLLKTHISMKPHWYKPKPEPLLAPTTKHKIAHKKVTITPALEQRDVGVVKMTRPTNRVYKPL